MKRTKRQTCKSKIRQTDRQTDIVRDKEEKEEKEMLQVKSKTILCDKHVIFECNHNDMIEAQHFIEDIARPLKVHFFIANYQSKFQSIQEIVMILQ